MKFTFNNRITKDDFPKVGENFDQQFINNYSKMVRELSQGLNGKLTFADNFNAQIITQSFAHGVQQTIANPFAPAIPTNAIVLGCDSGLSVGGTPIIKNIGSGLLGVTVQYDVPENYIFLQATASQSFTTATQTIVTFDATPVANIGNKITFDGTNKLTVSSSGLYHIYFQMGWATNTTGGRQAYIQKNNSTSIRYAFSSHQANSTNTDGHTGSLILPASANDFFQVNVFQASGGNLANQTSNGLPEFSMRMVGWDSTTSANVTLALLGS